METQHHTHTIKEQAKTLFDFESAASSHGWVALRPFEWDQATATLGRIHRLEQGQIVRLSMRDDSRDGTGGVQIEVESPDPLTASQEVEIRRIVRRMLRLDEDLADFYHLAAQQNGWTLNLTPGGGRLLRCPTLFEDIVYTLCTTNIAWSGTIRMVDRLTTKLGDAFFGRSDWQAFPTPAAIAAAGPEFLKQETGLGYRSLYVWELATGIVEGRYDLTAFEDPNLSPADLRKALRQIKGVGGYAAATILMLLGRYEHLAIDSELRAHVSSKYFEGQPVTDAQIQAIYEPWGRWRYLAYWFDAPNSE
jgi:3-methyladenine DNA glycosylase/8-oxoguanine DNA glycosylase